MPTVGQLIVDSLAQHGIDRVFCVPGESYLGLLDALYGRTDIDTVACRHEAGAGFMALADARLTDRPGVVMVSRGPGASNAAIALHTAEQDGVPLILLVGQVAKADVRRDSFQEIDYAHMYGRICKWTGELTDPAKAPEIMLRALRAATTGRPGPVVVALPEDVLTRDIDAEPVRPQASIRAAPTPDDAATLRRWLEAAERPLVLAGGGLDRRGGREVLIGFLEAWNLPVVVSFRRQDLVQNRHRLYAGDMGLANPDSQMRALRQADLLVVLGARLGDITTQGYTFPAMVRPGMRLVHVHADASLIGIQFATDLAIAADPVAAIEALGLPDEPPKRREPWLALLAEERQKIATQQLVTVDDGVPFERVVALVGETLPANAIVTMDAGTFGAPVYRLIPFAPPQRLLAPISGAMGFGVPAAVAAAMRHPGRPVICFVGDGGFLMTGSELTVAIERKLSLKLILSVNGSYASIRIHQERHYQGRAIATSFANPDFELIGRAYGFSVTRIRTRKELKRLPAYLAEPGPGFIIVDTSLKAVLPAPEHQSKRAAD